MTILRKFDKKSRLKKKINNDDTFTDTSSRTTDNCFNGDEKEVAKILQQLPQFILESESSYPFLFTWGVKKRRSAIDGSQSPPLSDSTCFSPPPPPPPPCICVRTISSDKSFIPSNPLSFSSSVSFFKQPTCKRKTSNKTKLKLKSKDALTNSSRKQENQRKTFVKLTMGEYNDQKFKNLEIKSSPRFPPQRDDELHSNSRRRRRRRFHLSSAGPTVFSPAPEEEEGSLRMVVADQSRLGPEINEKSQYPYSQIAQSLSAEVGLGMTKHLNPLGIPDLNFGPEENFFKSFGMNKQPPLQMC